MRWLPSSSSTLEKWNDSVEQKSTLYARKMGENSRKKGRRILPEEWNHSPENSTPQKKGVALRIHRILKENARSMMRCDGVAQTWWSEAVTTVVTRSQYTDLTPFENCFKTKPPLHYLRVFGAPGYCHVDETKRTQFDVGIFCCMFLGYAKHTKGYKGFDLETRTVETS